MTIVKELDALHVNGEEYKFPAGEGDMKYSDFSLVTKSGATITLDLFSEIEPSANFTVNAPSEIKEGQMYILRVTTGATPYTMTLGTGITNPYNESTTLTANTVHQFGFLAVDGALELQPSVTQSGGGTWGTITGTLSDQTDLQTALNAKADASDLNTKTFILSSTSDLTNAQAAYDWYAAGKNPIIMYNRTAYIVTPNDGFPQALNFSPASLYTNRDSSKTMSGILSLQIFHSGDTVTSIQTGAAGINILETDRNYSTPYTPKYNGSPATKKYVDDNVKTYTAGTGLTLSGTEFSADTTVLATKQDLANMGSYEVVATLPSASTADTKKIYLLGPIGTGDDKYEEYIITKEYEYSGAYVLEGGVGTLHKLTVDLNDYTQDSPFISQGEYYCSDLGIANWSTEETSCHGGSSSKYLWFSTNTGSTSEEPLTYNDVREDGGHTKDYMWGDGGNLNIRVSSDDWDNMCGGTVDIYIATNGSLVWDANGGEVVSVHNVWTKVGETSTNTKTFWMSSPTDYDNATAAVAWRNAGNNAIIVYNGKPYYNLGGSKRISYIPSENKNATITGYGNATYLDYPTLQFVLTFGDRVCQTIVGSMNGYYVLNPDYNYTTPYTPKYAGSPATKKYVDDNIKTYTAGTGLTLSGTEFSADTTILATKADLANYYTKTETYTKTEVENLIANIGSFEVVETLPSASTADTTKIYLLGPIGTGADKYEEWIVTEQPAQGHWESASTIDHDSVTVSDSGAVWNGSFTIQDKYIGIDNVEGNSQLSLSEQGSSDGYYYLTGASMPLVSAWGAYEVPVVVCNAYLGASSFDIYYSDSELTWSTTAKAWTKIGETSPDLSNKQDKATSGSTAPSTTPTYVGQQYVDTTNNKLYVATGTTSSSDWTEVGSGGSGGGGNVIAMTQAQYNALSTAEKNDGKLRIITDAPTEDISVDWSNVANKKVDLSTQTGNLSELKFWIGTTSAYQKLDSYDNNTVYICKKVIS